MRTATLLLLLPFLFFSKASAQSHYALLIGINEYEPKPSTPASFVSSRTKDGVKWTNLDGCVNDVNAIKAIITARFGFSHENIKTLLNAEATNRSIKEEIRKLKEKLKLGDIVFFYYTGHGSQVKNSLSYDGTGKDQTIVPSDLYDIRNKELSKLFNEILDKIGEQGKLTVIFDSCHSGGIARGKVSDKEPKSRDLPAVDEDFKDAAEYPKIEDRGALVFSAAQRDQPAKETSDDTGNAHGAFSYALMRSLSIAPFSETAERLFMRLTILLKASNRYQEPILGATEARKKQGLFGRNVENLQGKTVIPLVQVGGEAEIILQGGVELSLYPGAMLSKVQDKDTVLIKVTEQLGIGRCKGQVIKGNYRSLSKGDLFEVVKIAMPDKPNLTVYIPFSTFSNEELAIQTKDIVELAKNKQFYLITDPIDEVPSVVIQYAHNQWQINKVGNLKWEVLKDLTSETIKKKIPKGVNVFLQLPATKSLREQLKFGQETNNSAITITDNPSLAEYSLVGIAKDTIKYAWVKADFVGTKAKSIMPPRTNFFSQYSSVSDSLTQYALRLGRINAWTNLTSPPQEEFSFPYVLGVKNRETGKIYTLTDNVFDRDKMTLVLKADSAALENWDRKKRFCYVFAIDTKGNSTLLFPPRNFGNELFPTRSSPFLKEEPLKVNFKISAPFGLDTYFLLTTETPITDVSIFQANGVLDRGSKGGDNPLTKLLRNVGSRTRGIEPDTPSDWTIQKLMLNSLPKPQ